MKKTTLMKSVIAILSATTMSVLSTATAFAQDKSALDPDGFDDEQVRAGANAQCEVDIKINNESVEPTSPADSKAVYKVEVKWESLDFTYNGDGTWDAVDHIYEGGYWADSDYDRTVTVTNHSNWGITYTPSWVACGKDGDENITDAAASKNGVTATLDKITAQTIAKVPVGQADGNSDVFTVTVSGKPNTDEPYTLSKVNVAIAPTPAPAPDATP